MIAIGCGLRADPMFRGAEPQRVLTNLAFYLFGPALLFRLTARIDLGALPWVVIAGLLRSDDRAAARRLRVAAAARTVTARWRPGASGRSRCTFGNTVQLGIPVAIALFGEDGLAIHVADRQPARGHPADDRDRAGRAGPGAAAGDGDERPGVRDRADHGPEHGRAPGRAAGAARAGREPGRAAAARARSTTCSRCSGRAWCRCAWC